MSGQKRGQTLWSWRDRHELSCGCWEGNLGPLEEQQVLLTEDSSLQTPPNSRTFLYTCNTALYFLSSTAFPCAYCTHFWAGLGFRKQLSCRDLVGWSGPHFSGTVRVGSHLLPLPPFLAVLQTNPRTLCMCSVSLARRWDSSSLLVTLVCVCTYVCVHICVCALCVSLCA